MIWIVAFIILLMYALVVHICQSAPYGDEEGKQDEQQPK